MTFDYGVEDYYTETQDIVVPSWATQLKISLSGGGGWKNNVYQPYVRYGAGAKIDAFIDTTPGETLKLYVGKAGNGTAGGSGGASGGSGAISAYPWGHGGGGGGSSEVRTSAGVRIIVAGGGGGAGGWDGVHTWPEGGDSSAAGGTAEAGTASIAGGAGGGGGSQVAGGAGGAGYAGGGAGSAGSSSAGGNGGSAGTFGGGGGGGGGGYFSGGGGGGGNTPGGAQNADGGGGGGGSSYAGHAKVQAGTVTSVFNYQPRSGQIVVTTPYATPPVPQYLSPVNNGIIASATPTLYVILPFNDGVLAQRWFDSRGTAEIQLATDAAFTQNVRTITANRVFGAGFQGYTTTAQGTVPEAQRLSNQRWYMRARHVNRNGLASAWASTITFEVRQAATTSAHNPTGDATVVHDSDGNTFSWLSSAVGGQSAYQIQVSDPATGSVVVDTGKITTSANSSLVDIPDDQTNKQLRWRIRIYDGDDVAGDWSSYHLFRAGDPPEVEVSELTTIDNPNPTIAWTTVRGGGAITQHRVRVTRDSDGAEVYNSGWF